MRPGLGCKGPVLPGCHRVLVRVIGQGGNHLPGTVGHLVRRIDQRLYHLGLDFAVQESDRGPSSTSGSLTPRGLGLLALSQDEGKYRGLLILRPLTSAP